MIPSQLKAARKEIAVLRLLLAEAWGLVAGATKKAAPALTKKIGAVLKTGTDR